MSRPSPSKIGNFRGIQSLSSVISSLERRYLHQQDDEEEEENVNEGDGEDAPAAPADGGEKKKRRGGGGGAKSSKKLKPTKEEVELILDGEGFVDDSELMEEPEEVDEEEETAQVEETVPSNTGAGTGEISAIPSEAQAQSSKKFTAVKVDSNALAGNETNKAKMQQQLASAGGGLSEARTRFLAEHLQDWSPPIQIQEQLFALQEQFGREFATPKDWNTRRRKGLGPAIETALLKIDKQVRKALPDRERNLGYIARLVAVFPEPFTRGKVIAHLERILLTRTLRRKEKKLTQRFQEALEAIQRRLKSGLGVLPPPPPNDSSNILSHLSLHAINKSSDATDAESLSCMESIIVASMKELPSRDTIKRLLQTIQAWANRALQQSEFDGIGRPNPPPDIYIACREHLEQMLHLDEYFSWDGQSRGAVWRVGEACSQAAKARERLDAWCLERKMDLLIGPLAHGQAKNYRPKSKDFATYLDEAERRLLEKAFYGAASAFSTKNDLRRIGATANLARALREPPADYYFVNSEGDFAPFVIPTPPPKKIVPPPQAAGSKGKAGSTAAAPAAAAATIASSSGDVPTATIGSGANGEKTLGGEISSNTADADAAKSSVVAPNLTTSPPPVAAAAGTKSKTASAVDKQPAAQQQQFKIKFNPSKGKKFQLVTFRLEDFQTGGFVPQYAVSASETEASTKAGGEKSTAASTTTAATSSSGARSRKKPSAALKVDGSEKKRPGPKSKSPTESSSTNNDSSNSKKAGEKKPQKPSGGSGNGASSPRKTTTSSPRASSSRASSPRAVNSEQYDVTGEAAASVEQPKSEETSSSLSAPIATAPSTTTTDVEMTDATGNAQ